MGQTQSSDVKPSGSLDNVFPIDLAQDRNLDKLSMVAARILSTPDIYDIANLSRPGVCGDYAIFLKKEITKKLLPYVISLPDPANPSGPPQRTEILYQSVRAGADEATRKAVCSDMVDTMLRVVAIVLACLSSMQIASPSRPRTLKIQKGGAALSSISSPRDWLVANGFISETPNPIDPTRRAFTGAKVDLRRMSSSPRLAGTSLSILFESVRAETVDADFLVNAPNMLADGIRAMFLEPITAGPAGTKPNLLPIRILDKLGGTVAAGVLLRSGGVPLFKSLVAETPPVYLDELLYVIFRRKQGEDISLHEQWQERQVAGTQFSKLKSDPDAASSILSKIPSLQALLGIGGYQPAAPYGAAPGFGVGPTPYAAGVGLPPIQPYGIAQPAAPAPMVPAAYRPAAAPYSLLAPGAYAPPAAPGVYQIPLLAANNIAELFKKYAKIISTESTPAVVRAYALRGSMDPETRTFRPNACDDEYWTKKDLSNITPWATFQFLATKDWSKLSGQTSVDLDDEWNGFIQDLTSLYGTPDVPKFNVGATKLLNQMSFTGIKNLRLCASGEAPYVGFRKIQDGVLRLQGLYAEHVKRMWEILNSLISIIRDPERKIEVVRLNDAILSSTSSSDYVKQKSKETLRALHTYYIEVERTYVNTLKEIGKDVGGG